MPTRDGRRELCPFTLEQGLAPTLSSMHIRNAYLTVAVLSLLGAAQAVAAADVCSKRPYGQAMLTPGTPSPARLDTVLRVTHVRTELDPRSLPQVSPDGRSFFVMRRGIGLQFGPEPEGASPQVVDVPDIDDSTYDSYGRAAPFGWAADSHSVFAASQAHMRPRGGWALSGLKPLRLWRDGRVEALPTLNHPSGELDALYWAGGKGLALAEFGTRGGLYRPERKNPDPAFAFIDAVHGRVLSSIPFDTIPRLTPRRDGSDYAGVRVAAITMRPDGRLRALLRVAQGPWVILDQGQPPRLASIPPAQRFGSSAALSGDGRRVLVTPGLQASGVICEHNPNCPKPTPVEGPFAMLYELDSGKRLFELRATATDFWSYPPPALNADGTLALVGLPGRQDDFWPQVAVVSARRGGIVQTLCAADSSTNVLGFLPGAKMALGGVGVVAVYDLDRDAR